MSSLPTKPIVGINFPNTPIVRAAFEYIQKHNLPSTINHTLRSAIFALLAASKNPSWSSVDQESLAVACLLHDLGWSKSPDLTTPYKRFEVDGADAARKFLASANINTGKWTDGSLLQTVWYAIALHTNPGISLHTQPIVAATSAGIIVDFMGPMTPPFACTVSEEEFREVLKAYPRLRFADETKEIFCGLCHNKPETTFDNFVGQFGRKHVEGFAEKWEAATFENTVWRALEANQVYES